MNQVVKNPLAIVRTFEVCNHEFRKFISYLKILMEIAEAVSLENEPTEAKIQVLKEF